MIDATAERVPGRGTKREPFRRCVAAWSSLGSSGSGISPPYSAGLLPMGRAPPNIQRCLCRSKTGPFEASRVPHVVRTSNTSPGSSTTRVAPTPCTSRRVTAIQSTKHGLTSCLAVGAWSRLRTTTSPFHATCVPTARWPQMQHWLRRARTQCLASACPERMHWRIQDSQSSGPSLTFLRSSTRPFKAACTVRHRLTRATGASAAPGKTDVVHASLRVID